MRRIKGRSESGGRSRWRRIRGRIAWIRIGGRKERWVRRRRRINCRRVGGRIGGEKEREGG